MVSISSGRSISVERRMVPTSLNNIKERELKQEPENVSSSPDLETR